MWPFGRRMRAERYSGRAAEGSRDALDVAGMGLGEVVASIMADERLRRMACDILSSVALRCRMQALVGGDGPTVRQLWEARSRTDPLEGALKDMLYCLDALDRRLGLVTIERTEAGALDMDSVVRITRLGDEAEPTLSVVAFSLRQ